MMVDPFTKKVLWDFWKKSDDQEGVVDEGFFDVEEANNDCEQETAKIFRIETNLFDYETPLCTEFKELNFLLKVDPELLTHDNERTKTYKDYENKLNDELEEPWSEDRVPYEMCDYIFEPFRFKNGKAKWPTCNSNEDGFCNGEELPGMVRVGYMTYFQDYEWYNKLADGNSKEEVLKQKAIYERSKERNERCNSFNDAAHNAPVCKIRRFEMIKYSFGQDEFSISENEFIDIGFAKFNTIVTSLKALDESFSSKNYVRKFLRALRPKWRAKFTAIQESNYLSSLSLDELIDNLKVHEMIMEKDSELVGGKREKRNSLSLKAKKESSDDENSMSGKVQMKNTLWW
ncbi:hypothetical protein Tco_0243174 [Tanacetum coccineum]